MAIDKNRPSAQWIAALRGQYQTEREIDRVLTRRMQRRSGPGFQPLQLGAMVNVVESIIRSNIGSAFTDSDARWLSGGASELQMAFKVTWARSRARAN